MAYDHIMLEDDALPEAGLRLSGFNFGLLPMSNGLTRLQTRFLGEPESLENASRDKGDLYRNRLRPFSRDD